MVTQGLQILRSSSSFFFRFLVIFSESQQIFHISDENLLPQLLAKSGEVIKVQNSNKNNKQTNKAKTVIGGGGDGRRVAAGGEGGDLRRRRQHVQVHPPLQGLQQTGGRNF